MNDMATTYSEKNMDSVRNEENECKQTETDLPLSKRVQIQFPNMPMQNCYKPNKNMRKQTVLKMATRKIAHNTPMLDNTAPALGIDSLPIISKTPLKQEEKMKIIVTNVNSVNNTNLHSPYHENVSHGANKSLALYYSKLMKSPSDSRNNQGMDSNSNIMLKSASKASKIDKSKHHNFKISSNIHKKKQLVVQPTLSKPGIKYMPKPQASNNEEIINHNLNCEVLLQNDNEYNYKEEEKNNSNDKNAKIKVKSQENKMILELVKKAGTYVFDDGQKQFRSKSEKKRYQHAEKKITQLNQILNNSPDKKNFLQNVKE